MSSFGLQVCFNHVVLSILGPHVEFDTTSGQILLLLLLLP